MLAPRCCCCGCNGDAVTAYSATLCTAVCWALRFEARAYTSVQRAHLVGAHSGSSSYATCDAVSWCAQPTGDVFVDVRARN